MVPILSVLALAGGVTAWPPPPPPSFLFKMRVTAEKQVSWDRGAYCPEEGDILLFDDHSTFFTRIYKLVGTDGPLHAAIVVRRFDGSLAVLEAGANFTPKVQFNDVEKRLHEFSGTILVRRLKQPLAAEQSKKLTDFAMAQEGKSYSIPRLVLQMTPLRPRGVLQSFLAKTSLDRDRWICSELVAAAATSAGVMDGKEYHTNTVFPRDLCYDETVNLSEFYEPPALWYPRDHLDFIGGGVRVTPAP